MSHPYILQNIKNWQVFVFTNSEEKIPFSYPNQRVELKQ